MYQTSLSRNYTRSRGMAPLQHNVIMCLHLPLRAATKRTMDGAITQLSFVYVRGQQLISPQHADCDDKVNISVAV